MSSRPQLVLVSTAFQQDYEVGFANAAARAGLRVALVGSDNTLTSRLEPHIQFLNPRGAQNPQRSTWRKLFNMLGYFRGLSTILRSHRDAVVHHNGIFTLRRGWGVLIEAWIARRSSRTWWLTVHNILPHDRVSRADLVSFRWAYQHADRLWVHTAATMSELVRRFGIPAARITVIEHGIDRFVDPDESASERLRRIYGLPAHGFLALAFGNISRYKGTDLLVEAICQMKPAPDALVLIAGRASDAGYRLALEARLAEVRLPVQVRLIDQFIPDEHLPLLHSAADLMVLPYRQIEQSGVLFAAKAAGCPLLMSDVGSFRDYLQDDYDQIVPAEDTAALATALDAAIAKGRLPTIQRRLRVRQARQHYAWDTTLRDYCADVVAHTCARADHHLHDA